MNRKGIITEYLPWIMISVAVLAIVLISLIVFKEKGISIIDSIKNLLRW